MSIGEAWQLTLIPLALNEIKMRASPAGHLILSDDRPPSFNPFLQVEDQFTVWSPLKGAIAAVALGLAGSPANATDGSAGGIVGGCGTDTPYRVDN